MKPSSRLQAAARRRAIQILAVIALGIVGCVATACSDFNPFSPSVKTACVSWASLHPADTSHASTLTQAHPDSVCTPRH